MVRVRVRPNFPFSGPAEAQRVVAMDRRGEANLLALALALCALFALPSVVSAQDPPTSLSAVHTTPTVIRVYWLPPTTGTTPTEYEITYFAGIGDTTGTAMTVGGSSTDNYEITGLSDTVMYHISIVSVNGSTRSDTTGPVPAARGPGLALKGVVLPNHSVLRRDPSVIGEDDDALYCVTDDITCCGTPPSPSDGGSGNGRGQWYLGNAELTSSTANANPWYASWLAGAVLLNFRGITTTGADGLYRCDIQDNTGTLYQFYTCVYDITVASQCVVVITSPIQFSLQTSPTTYPLVFTLSCVSTGGPATTVTWMQNGAVVSYDTNNVFTQTVTEQVTATYSNVLTVTGREPGNYHCSVSNNRTAQPATASLTVTDPDPPSNLRAALDNDSDTLTITWVLPMGDPPIGYVITYEETAESSDTGSVPVLSGTATELTIPGRDGNQYTVTIRVLSIHFPSITVETVSTTGEDPPVITDQPTSLEIVAGQTATFSVIAIGVDLTYMWLMDGTVITGVTSATYTIAIVTESDEGQYQCIVTNAAGTTTSEPANLTVLDPPMITGQPTSLVLVLPGQSFTFTVVATGDSLVYRWQKDGADISGANSATYTIEAVAESDEGQYWCVVSNAAGNSTSATANLTVLDPPIITAQPVSLVTALGEPVNFTVVAIGDNLMYQWLKDGAEIPNGANSVTYTIAVVEESDEGRYWCVVRNAAGSTNSTTANLTVLTPTPSPSPPPTINSGSGSGSGSEPALMACEYNGELLYDITRMPQRDEETGRISDTFTLTIGSYNDTSNNNIYASQVEGQDQCSTISITYNSTSDSLTINLTALNINFATSCVFNLALMPDDTAPLYCPIENITVVIRVIPVLSPPTCSDAGSTIIVASEYSSVAESLSSLDCSLPGVFNDLSYIVSFDDMQFQIQDVDFSPIFRDYFVLGTHNVSITVCRSDAIDVCNEDPLLVLFEVLSYDGRLFPYGTEFSDQYLDNVDDRAAQIVVTKRIPVWSQYYSSIYLSTNGLASLGTPFTSWSPSVFPYGRTRAPILAPYWNDLDFRNSVPESALYYNIYSVGSSRYPQRAQAFLNEFSDRLNSYEVDEDFVPEWLLVATWSKATPYYGRRNEDETLTFQLVLATDYVRTFAFYLYEEEGINWDPSRVSRRVVIGYDAKNYIDYDNVALDSTEYLNIDTIMGNTGYEGQWFFELVSDTVQSPIEQCLIWARSQPKDLNFDDLGSCPCTRQQARRDWRFFFGHNWGLSSRPECATFISWRRRRNQISLECCYDDASGALIVGPRNGGTYKRYSSLFNPSQNYLQDILPYQQCCIDSDYCATYYMHRPSDDCSGYVAPRPSFLWGDPHLQSADGIDYTFNGRGEYVLLRAGFYQLEIQTRFVELNETVMVTITTGIAIAYRSLPHVEILIDRSTQQLHLYIGGVEHPLPAEDSMTIVSPNGTYDNPASFSMSGADPAEPTISIVNSEQQLTLTVGNDTASLMVAQQSTFLRTTLELGSVLTNNTRGLVGVFNGDPSDDFTLPNGNVIEADANESTIYYSFGLEWHVASETDSIFSYARADESFANFNADYNTYTPIFSDTLTEIAPDICEDDRSCIFDILVSGDPELAMTTLEASQDNRDTVTILENSPPNITGDFIIHVIAGVMSVTSYTVEDDNGTDHVTLKTTNTTDITLAPASPDSHTLTWPMPEYDLPQTTLQLFANDTLGASTLVSINIILCACRNGGTCVDIDVGDTEQLLFNTHGHYRLICSCPSDFIGETCETDVTGCTLDPCPDYTTCRDNSSAEGGYSCSDCQMGYGLGPDGKCADINECETALLNNCSQSCTNTDGSYECNCMPGYRLDEDRRTCTDIDECEEGSDDCVQFCINNDGSYTCNCLPGFTQLGSRCLSDSQGCADEGAQCDNGLMCTYVIGDSGSCYCASMGELCTGNCSGTASQLTSGTQQCTSCSNNTYGFYCSRTCLCVNGYCDVEDGCICDAGWTGYNCNTEINMFSPDFSPTTPSSIELPWDVPSGSPILTVLATDNDVSPHPNVVSYTLVRPADNLQPDVSDGIGIFSIDSTTGLLRLVQDLNTTRGNYSRFVLTIEARDNGTLPRQIQQLLTITPIDVVLPVPEFSQNIYMVMVNEDLGVNETFFNASCFERSPVGDPTRLVTVLVPDNNSDFFALVNGTAVIVNQELDYEVLDPDFPVYTIRLECTNRFNLTTTTIIEIEIVNVNDNPLMFNNITYSIAIPEDTAEGTIVFNVTASDADNPGLSPVYRIDDSFNDFDIDSVTGEILVSSFNPLDRETPPAVYNLTVYASDDTITINTSFTIELTDVNDNSPLFSRGVFFVANLSTLNQTGDFVITVTATDLDIGDNSVITYGLETNPYFTIDNATGVVRISHSPIPFGPYEYEVYATDSGQIPLSSTALLDITIQPSPERIEFSIAAPDFSISEGAPRGILIGFIGANVTEGDEIIPPSLISPLRYTIVSGTDTTIFHLVSETGELILLSSLDYESIDNYILEVEASIPMEPLVQPATAIVMIRVTDINDNSPVFIPSFYARTVEEFTAIDTSVLEVSATDSDSGQNGEVKYRLDSSDVPFRIDSTTGILYVNDTLDTPQDFRFRVFAEDRGSPVMSSEAIIFISVVRSISITVQFDQGKYTFNVSENATIGSVVGSVRAITEGTSEISAYDHIVYRIRIPDIGGPMDGSGSGIGNDPFYFHIDEVTGEISSFIDFDRESQESYGFYVEAFNTNLSVAVANASVRIVILDVNDNQPVFSQSLYTAVIIQSTPRETSIAQVQASDLDTSVNAQIDYDIESGILGFGVDSSTGEVTVVNTTLFIGQYSLTVLATDRGASPLTGSATLFIAVIPSAPGEVTFSEDEYNFTVLENSGIETFIGSVQAVDGNSQSLTDIEYTFTYNTDCLHIDPRTGDIRVFCLDLDRESQSRYEVVVLANHTGEQSNGSLIYGEVKVVIDILDENDNAPVFTRVVYSNIILDTFGVSAPVVTVKAQDADIGTNAEVSYELVGSNNGTLTPDETMFTLNETSGDIFLSNDMVLPGDYRLIVLARDHGNPSIESVIATVFICINHGPPAGLIFSNTTFIVSENHTIGDIVGTVVLMNLGMPVNPNDFPNNLVFSLVEEGNVSSTFYINSESGVIRTLASLDRERQELYIFLVRAVFESFENVTEVAHITVMVTDINDNAPFFSRNIYSALIDTSYQAGDLIPVLVAITANDIDEGLASEISFDIESGTPFGINTTTGQLFVANATTLEAIAYQFSIFANDSGSPQMYDEAAVTIIVTHALPEFISFPPTPFTFNYTEELPVGTPIGVVAVEQDTPAVMMDLQYDIVGESDFFRVFPTSGVVINTVEIDREMYQQLNFTVRAFFPGNTNLSNTTVVIVDVLDINDNRPVFDEEVVHRTIPTTELSTTVPLVNLSVTDADEGINQEIDLRLQTTPNVTGLFRIEAGGMVFATTTALDPMVYTFEIVAEDRGQPTLSSTATAVINVQIPSPDVIFFTQSVYHFNISENIGATSFIGQVELEMIDEAFQSFVTFNSATIEFTVAQSSGEITSNVNFDFEIQRYYVFTITAVLDIPFRDPPLYLNTTATVNVSIIDENDNSPQFVNFPFFLQFDENVTMPLIVVQISARDEDSGSNSMLTYSIANDVDNAFSINGTTGEITMAPSLDRESQENYTLTIIVRDAGTSPRQAESSLQFQLLDINDNPPSLISGLTYNASERISAGTLVFQFVGDDTDLRANGNIRFQLQNEDAFNVDEDTGIVTLSVELDYESQTSYSLTLTLRDNWPEDTDEVTNSVDYAITINVIDRPDTPPEFDVASSTTEIDPRLSNNEVLTTIIATDADGDILTYSITNTVSEFAIRSSTGEIFSTADRDLIPESNFTLIIEVIDDSEWTLSSTLTVIIIVQPFALQFTSTIYRADVLENINAGFVVASLDIEVLSVSSDIVYSLQVAPVGGQSRFAVTSEPGLGVITLVDALDRESLDSYTITVTATRLDESTITTLLVTVLDNNDNTPTITDDSRIPIPIEERILSGFLVTKINATDRDIDANAELHFEFATESVLPFEINANTGDVTVSGTLDYESTQSYSLPVKVSDGGSPPRSTVVTYTINIININDNIPQFLAPAYFGEVYAGSPANYPVHHIILEATDKDDPADLQALTFSITLPPSESRSGYELQVSDREPYYVIAVSIPDSAPSEIVVFTIEVTDEGGLSSTAALYLSIFTLEHLIPLTLDHVTKEDFLSCLNSRRSVCLYKSFLALELTRLIGSDVSVFNDSVSTSTDDIQQLQVMLYAWHGVLGARDSNGKLLNAAKPQNVNYLSFESNVATIQSAAATIQDQFDFIGEVTTTAPTTVTPEGGGIPIVVIAGIATGGGVAALTIILIIVLVVVFGRRRRHVRDRDPYDRYAGPLAHNKTHSKRGRLTGKRSDEIALTQTGASDLAYETMYDDDEGMGTQTMPWFDPNYLAMKGHGDEEYMGDTENTQHRMQTSPFRATVDGDARRGRRCSSEESAGSVQNMDHSEYLKGYQESTPMAPGQRGAEYDMFAQPGGDADRPHRPSLSNVPWEGRNRTSEM